MANQEHNVLNFITFSYIVHYFQILIFHFCCIEVYSSIFVNIKMCYHIIIKIL